MPTADVTLSFDSVIDDLTVVSTMDKTIDVSDTVDDPTVVEGPDARVYIVFGDTVSAEGGNTADLTVISAMDKTIDESITLDNQIYDFEFVGVVIVTNVLGLDFLNSLRILDKNIPIIFSSKTNGDPIVFYDRTNGNPIVMRSISGIRYNINQDIEISVIPGATFEPDEAETLSITPTNSNSIISMKELDSGETSEITHTIESPTWDYEIN